MGVDFVRVSVCVIMRNEEMNIERCLRSVAGAVDEIVVVDTGSTDASVQIARRFTDQVYFYEWDHDFSRAKNFALEQATGDWIVFLDADEYFSVTSRTNIRGVILSCMNDCDILQVYCQNIDQDKDNMPRDAFYALRIFRRTASLKYTGSVHESVVPMDGKQARRMNVDKKLLLLYHTGYSSELVKKKCARNLAILQREIEANPDKPLRFRYLADCYFGLQDFQQAAAYARREIALNRPPDVEPSRPYHVLYDCLKEMGASAKEKMDALELGMQAFPERPDFWAEYGAVLYSEGKPNKALVYFRKAEKLHAKYDDSRDFCLLTRSLPMMYELMAGIYKRRGDRRHAIEYEKKCRKISGA